MRIIANHAHLMPPHTPGSPWPEGDADMLLRHLDLCGIERAVIFPPFACQMEGSMMRANRWALHQVRQHADRFIAAGTVFPLAPDIVECLHMLHDEGVKLLKIHPAIDPHNIADPRAHIFYAKAQELGMALDYHTGPHNSRLSNTRPEAFDDIAWDYPGLKLVFEHMGGRTYIEDFMAILANHKPGRVFGGLTSVLQPEHKMWYLNAEKVAELLRCVGAERLIFGLDFPWNPPESTLRDLEIIRNLSLGEADLEKILGGNLLTLL